MGNIVELREMSNADLEEKLEGLREEAFNLRFQVAGRRLQNTARVKVVRRDVAQILSVLRNRQVAIDTAASHPDVANALKGKEWNADARFIYEDSAYSVNFDEDGSELATVMVDLNKKQPRTRRERAKLGRPKQIVNYDVK